MNDSNTERYFKKNGAIIKLSRDYGEPEEHFVESGIFIVSQKPTNSEEYEDAIKMSRLYRNHKYDKAGYNPSLMDKLEEMTVKMFDE